MAQSVNDIGLSRGVEQPWLQAASLHDCMPVLLARQSATFQVFSHLQHAKLAVPLPLQKWREFWISSPLGPTPWLYTFSATFLEVAISYSFGLKTFLRPLQTKCLARTASRPASQLP